MTKQQELRKQTEEAKLEAFSLMCKKVAELENKIADIKANCDLAIEGRDVKIKELEKGCEETQELLDKQIEATYKLDKKNAELTDRLEDLQEDNSHMFNTIALQEQQIEKMKCCSNCKHFNKEEDIEYCQNCERHLVNSLDNLKAEEIIKDEWEIKENV